MSRGQVETCLDWTVDRRPGCKPTILFRRVRRYGDYVHLCHPCDDVHEAGSWFTVLGQRFHVGLVTVTVLRSLRKRLRACLVKQLGMSQANGWELEQLAAVLGPDAVTVLHRLAELEAKR